MKQAAAEGLRKSDNQTVYQTPAHICRAEAPKQRRTAGTRPPLALPARPAACLEPVRKPAEHRILLRGRTVTYELTRKSVKNINLRVRRDGSVAVSAPRSVSLASVEAFLREKQDWLLLALLRTAARSPAMPERLADGTAIQLFGVQKTLCFVPGPRNSAAVSGNALMVSLSRPDDPALRQRVLTAWLRDRCREAVLACCRAHYPRFAALGVAPPTVRFRSMKTRWGSCQPAKGVLTFNYALVHASPACIEYVVLHEFTHFLHPDHSAAFYACLSGYLPDWKQRREELNRNAP